MSTKLSHKIQNKSSVVSPHSITAISYAFPLDLSTGKENETLQVIEHSEAGKLVSMDFP